MTQNETRECYSQVKESFFLRAATVKRSQSVFSENKELVFSGPPAELSASCEGLGANEGCTRADWTPVYFAT